MKYDPRATRYIKNYYFDQKEADKVVYFFENHLVHIKGSQFANKKFILDPWQKWIVTNLFAWKEKKTGLRRYREAYIEIPRKNGKSTLCAGLGLYLLYVDKEEGAEVYSAGSDKNNAKIVFNVAKEMVVRNKKLKSMSDCWKDSIVFKQRASSYLVISADADTKHGFNAHGIIFDELHAQPSRDLYDVLLTSTASRLQPLMISITTAGFDRNSICYEKHAYSKRIIEGLEDDPSFFPIIYGADERDDFTDPKVWAKANPGLGVSVSEQYLEKECKKAISNPAYENTFKRLHLNMWTEQDVRWLQMLNWKQTTGKKYTDEQLKQWDAWLGIDLSTTTDLSCVAMVFKNPENKEIIVRPKFWLPKEKIKLKIEADKVPYDIWTRQGFLELTEGRVIDYDYIFNYIENLGRQGFKIRDIGYDPHNATQFALKLQNAGFNAVEVRQSPMNLNEASKEFEKLVISGLLIHEDNPIMEWMAMNVVIRPDSNGNVKPDKAKSKTRIDGIVASIIGLSRLLLSENVEKASVYQKKKLTVL